MANQKIRNHTLQPKVNDEQIFNILEKQIEEKSIIYGRPAFFIEACNIKSNDVLQEVTSKEFQLKHTIPIYYLNDDDTEDLDGSTMYGGFNMIPIYNKIIYVPVSFFKDRNTNPASGDLIFLPENNQESMLFEIVKDPEREQDRKNTKNGRIFAYKLILKLYSASRGETKYTGDIGDLLPDDEFDLIPEDLDQLDDLLDSLNQEDEKEPPIHKKQVDVSSKKTKVDQKNLGRFEDM